MGDRYDDNPDGRVNHTPTFREQVRKSANFADRAEAAGWSMGGVTVETMAEIEAKLQAWRADLSRGVVPSEFSGKSLSEAKELVMVEMIDFIRLEKQYFDYVYPKLRSMDVQGADGGPVEMVISWQQPPKESE